MYVVSNKEARPMLVGREDVRSKERGYATLLFIYMPSLSSVYPFRFGNILVQARYG